MKIFIFIALYIFSPVFAQALGFINPLTFDNSEKQKEDVLIYIQNKILQAYCGPQSIRCHSSIIVIEREENLKAFYKLTKIKNKKYLNDLINEYCNSVFFRCTYTNLLSAYEENLWFDKNFMNVQKASHHEELGNATCAGGACML